MVKHKPEPSLKSHPLSWGVCLIQLFGDQCDSCRLYQHTSSFSFFPPFIFSAWREEKVCEIVQGDSRVKESLWKADVALASPVPGAGMHTQCWCTLQPGTKALLKPVASIHQNLPVQRARASLGTHLAWTLPMPLLSEVPAVAGSCSSCSQADSQPCYNRWEKAAGSSLLRRFSPCLLTATCPE